MSKFRIAFCRISQETNALSPLRTEVEDFRRTHFYQGEELLERCGRWGYEAPGLIRNAELSGFVRSVQKLGQGKIEAVPLFSAWTVPAGPLSAEAHRFFCERIVTDLTSAGDIDAVYMSFHGALRADDTVDPEADMLAAVRSVLGPDAPVAVSLDLHAHLTSEMMAHTGLFSAYRTNPHRDHAGTGYRSGALLIGQLLEKHHPTVAWRALPMVLGGGTTLDFMPTMRPIFRRMTQMEKDPRVLDVSLLMCQLWNDAPDLGWATLLLTDNDPALAEELAEELAELAWAVRHKLPPELPDASEAVALARAATWRRRLGTVCLSDASDMVGAGATGENTKLLRVLLDEAADMRCHVPIRDANLVAALWDQSIGDSFESAVGGTLDPDRNPPITISGVLLLKRAETLFGRSVLVQLGHVYLVVTEGPPLCMKPDFYTQFGLSTTAADITVVKSLFPFRLYFLAYNRLTLYARTGGITDFDVYRDFTFDGPTHPKDAVDCWRAGDHRRRIALA
ncbi:MAG: hypothetical protein GWP91_11680 [Rhodobacterales bacterium]|nr:hypothetical protein [Rhodobacterales bacterium]